MSSTVGAFEAKTHLSALLDRVERGEEIVITKHGRPVARLAPMAAAPSAAARQAIEQLRLFRANHRLGGVSWRELRDSDRKG
jgi:prevent-host-death family protein